MTAVLKFIVDLLFWGFVGITVIVAFLALVMAVGPVADWLFAGHGPSGCPLMGQCR